MSVFLLICRPHHLLIPRGTEQGQDAELFVMISNFHEDQVHDNYSVAQGECNDAVSYCGIRDKKFPDNKAMGYPFDRLGRHDAHVLKQFLTPNMCVTDVKIIHKDITVPNPNYPQF
jgi:tyrosinase